MRRQQDRPSVTRLCITICATQHPDVANIAFGSFLGLTFDDYSPEDEENPSSYQAAAPQYNFDTPGRLVIPGEEMPNFALFLPSFVLRFMKHDREVKD